MKHKFTLGIVSGMSILALAVPLLAQGSSAAFSGTTTTGTGRPAMKQENITDRIARDDAFLANVDAMVSIQKSATQTHRNALTAAAALTDETAQQEAMRAADEAYRTTIQDALKANPDLQSAMMPFGGRGQGMRGGMMGRGPMNDKIAEELGMTTDELKAALEGGKTIQEIATEKGVTLPTPPKDGRGRGPMHGFDGQDSTEE
ncbi:MAG: hypothetical protein PHN33_05075 [Candidatus Peribacteraceae bacterium]|nr:hypothetical protein [Candidatus Peribacteraceae bacterium]